MLKKLPQDPASGAGRAGDGSPGMPRRRQEQQLRGQPRGSALAGWVLAQGAENRLKTPLAKEIWSLSAFRQGGPRLGRPGRGASNRGVTQQQEGWREGRVLAPISATSLADSFSTVAKQENFPGTGCSPGAGRSQQRSRRSSPDVRAPAHGRTNYTLCAVPGSSRCKVNDPWSGRQR